MKYNAKLIDVGLVTISTGSTKLVIKCECKDGEKKLTRTGDFFLTEKAKARTFDVLNTIGYLWQDDNMLDVDSLDAYEKGVEFEVVTEVEQGSDGKSYEKIQFINPLGSGGIKNKLASDQKATVMMGLNVAGDVMSNREKYGKKGVKQDNQVSMAIDSSDIPF